MRTKKDATTPDLWSLPKNPNLTELLTCIRGEINTIQDCIDFFETARKQHHAHGSFEERDRYAVLMAERISHRNTLRTIAKSLTNILGV